MRVVNRKGSRSLSPSELRELYGLTMHEIYSAERSFLKESYKKDKQDLQYHLDALTTEHATKLREMEHQRKMFIREHEKTIRHPNRKKTYQKTFSVSDLPESAVPPCIPFIGVNFPPKRHARSARSVSDLRIGRLLSRNTNMTSFTGLELDSDDDCHAEVAKVIHDDLPSSSAQSTNMESKDARQLRSSNCRSQKESTVVLARPKSVTSSRRESRPEDTSMEDIETAVNAYESRNAMNQENEGVKEMTLLIRHDSKETISRQDTPSKGSDVTSTSLDDDRLLQELHEYAQHMVIKSKWVTPDEVAQLQPVFSLCGSLATPRPNSELLGQSPQPESLPTAVSPSAGNTNVTPQEELDGRGRQVKEMVDEWLDKLHTTPIAFSKNNIRSEWHQLCGRIADLHTDPPDDSTADGDNEECETDRDIKLLIACEDTISAAMVEEKSMDQDVATIHPKQTLNVGSAASADHLSQKSSPAQSDTEPKRMKSSAQAHDSKTPFLASLLSSKQLSTTYPTYKPKSGAPYLLIANTEADNSIRLPPAATDHRENSHSFTAPDSRRDCSDTNSTIASYETEVRPTTEGQPPTERVFRRRAKTADNCTKPVGTFQARAETVLGHFSAPQPRRGVGRLLSREEESSTITPTGETTLLAALQPRHSIRRLSSDSKYSSYSEDRRFSCSSNIVAPESDTGRHDLNYTGLNSRTMVTRIASGRAKLASYTEPTHPASQSTGYTFRPKNLSTASDKRPKSACRSTHSPQRVIPPSMRAPGQIKGNITPCSQSQHSVIFTLPSVTGATKQNLKVSDIILPSDDNVPERSLEGKRVSFSSISRVQSMSSQSLNTDAVSHEEIESETSRPRRRSFVPNSGSRADSDRLLQRQSTNVAGTSRQGHRKRSHSSCQTRSDATPTSRKSRSESNREARVEDMTLGEYQDYLRKEVSPPEQEVMLHTDARGQQHKLLVSKVSLHGTSSREANVTILHEDNVEKSKAEEADEMDEMSGPSQDVPVNATNAAEEPVSHQASPRKGGLSKNQSRSSSIGADEDENIALWRKRLSHPRRASFSWIPEFAQDKDAQALALALLARKRGVGEGADRFKAVAQALAAANHLLQKRHRETMMIVEELRHCRYLRMPTQYMAEEFQELSWADVFA